jgi:hypothetical protein
MPRGAHIYLPTNRKSNKQNNDKPKAESTNINIITG